MKILRKAEDCPSRSRKDLFLQVVSPVYNEEEVISLYIEKIRKQMEELGVRWELLLVDDGSVDKGPLIIKELIKENSNINLLQLSRNFGHQAALKCGYDHVNPEANLIISMDCDLQHPPSMIEELIDAWEKGFDVIHTEKLSTEDLNPWRKVCTELAYQAINKVASVYIVPQSSDFRGLSSRALEAILSCPEKLPLLRGLSSWVGYNQCVLSYHAEKRALGESKYNFKQLFILFERSVFDYSHFPLSAFTYLGMASMVFSTFYLLFLLILYLFGASSPSGWLTLILMMLFYNSITLLFLGSIGMYISKTYNGVRKRPNYIVQQADQ